ncbi:MAG: hypothetical protein JXQ90_01570 [Cyclobacteriaceae bacterium]
MSDLNKEQLTVIQELIEDVMSKAVDVLQQMLNIPLKTDSIVFGNGPLREIDDIEALGRFKVHLMKVRIKGEMNGSFFFIINRHEVDQINRVCLPDSVNNVNSSDSKMMKKGFMMEIENIVASLSITEISEALGTQAIGAVPETMIMPGHEVNKFLMEQNEENNTQFYVKSVLAGKIGVDIAPYFIWMLDEHFVEKIKENVVVQ